MTVRRFSAAPLFLFAAAYLLYPVLLRAVELIPPGVSVAEPDSGYVTVTLPVTLSAPSLLPVSVSYATASGTAAASADFTSAKGLLTFGPGEISKAIAVRVLGDVLDENDETFTVTLTAIGASLPVVLATVTIIDNDAAPSVSVGDSSATEGDAANVSLPIAATLSTPSGKTITVAWATLAGTASTADFRMRTGSLTFLPGKTSATTSVVVLPDLRDEADETILIQLSAPSGAVLGRAGGVATIVDNDPTPSLTLSDVAATEGDSGKTTTAVTVALSAPSGRTVTADYATASGTATSGSDFTARSGSLTFLPGKTSLVVNLSLIGDLRDEPDETLTLSLSNAANAITPSLPATITIVDNDPLPSLAVSDLAITEGDTGTRNARFTVALSAVSGKTITASWRTANDTATAGSDFVAASGVVTFTPGQTARTFDVRINGDVVPEGVETFKVALSGATSAEIGRGTAICTILDNDAPAITNIDPNQGFTTGDEQVTIEGINLVGATVAIGGGAAVVTDTTSSALTFTTPTHAAGIVDITVTTAAGSATLAGAFTFIAPPVVVPAPLISAIEPQRGPTGGGQLIAITGANLADSTFTVDGQPARVTETTAATATIVAPPHVEASVDVIVTTAGGSATAPNRYAYVGEAPTIVVTATDLFAGSSESTGIAVVHDADDAPGELFVMLDDVPEGITVDSITNTSGTVSATVSASCTAAPGPHLVVLRVRDGAGMSSSAVLTVNVAPNDAPAPLHYDDTFIAAGEPASVHSSEIPSDSGSVVVTATASDDFSGSVAADSSTGVVSIMSVRSGTYTMAVTATDNCDAATTSTFAVTAITPDPQQMERVAFFYGYPGWINGAADLDASAAWLYPYDVVVMGFAEGTLSDATAVAARLKSNNPAVRIFGYIDIGSTAHYGEDEMRALADRAFTAGATGVFWDEYGYDFETTRARQNNMVDYVHGKGMSVFVNAWNPDDVFSPAVTPQNPGGLPAHLGKGDYYLLESFVVNTGVPWSSAPYMPNSIVLSKLDKIGPYRAATGVKMVALSYINESRPDAGRLYEYALAFATYASLDGFAAAVEDIGGSTNRLASYTSTLRQPLGWYGRNPALLRTSTGGDASVVYHRTMTEQTVVVTSDEVTAFHAFSVRANDANE